MSLGHHSERNPMIDELRQKALLEQFKQQQEGVSPRSFPQGRLNGDDDGQLLFKVGGDKEKGVVAIEFAKPVNWVAMSPQDAVQLAQMLIKHAREIAKEPLQVVLH